MGNYMPKCKQNFVMGIKMKWTLSSKENWYATHRFAGKLWVVGGIISMFCAFLPIEVAFVVLFGIVVAMTVPVVVYSWRYYEKQKKEGTAGECPAKWKTMSRTAKIITAVSLALIIPLVAVVMLVGEVTVDFDDTGFKVDASFCSASYIEYASVESVQLRSAKSAGTRTFGVGSAKLLAGSFHNDEFGNYTRYSYTNSKFEVVLKVDGKIIVIGLRDEAQAQQIYDQIFAKIGG